MAVHTPARLHYGGMAGFSFAKNSSDAEAEATLCCLNVHAIRPEMMDDEAALQAVWLIDGYDANGPAAVRRFRCGENGRTTAPYPLLPYIGLLLHSALGSELSDFMQGNESCRAGAG